jgi:site-specific DNA recombinase
VSLTRRSPRVRRIVAPSRCRSTSRRIRSGTNVSGAILERPALTRLREAVREKRVDTVLVYDLDRLSRDIAHQFLLVGELERAGARVEFLQMPREDSMHRRLFFTMRAGFAEFERELIRERTMRREA